MQQAARDSFFSFACSRLSEHSCVPSSGAFLRCFFTLGGKLERNRAMNCASVVRSSNSDRRRNRRKRRKKKSGGQSNERKPKRTRRRKRPGSERYGFPGTNEAFSTLSPTATLRVCSSGNPVGLDHQLLFHALCFRFLAPHTQAKEEAEAEDRRKRGLAAAGHCDACGNALVAKKAFSRFEFRYCSSDCANLHKRKLAADAAERRFNGGNA